MKRERDYPETVAHAKSIIYKIENMNKKKSLFIRLKTLITPTKEK